MGSLWEMTAELPKFESLKRDAKTDVLIIGGGMAGLLCAYFLKKSGVDNILVEAGRICGGTTGNTTAKITAQHGLIYDSLLRRFGAEKAGLYLRANLEALEKYRLMCENISCGFSEQNSFVYSLTDKEVLDKELRALEKLGYHAKFCSSLSIPLKTAGAICFEKQAQFHPIMFLSETVKDLAIFENTRVRKLRPGKAITEYGNIEAEKIIVATHFPFINRHGSYFLKLYQHRSYVIALKGAENPGGMYIDCSGEGLSFRESGDLLLLGGGGHRSGTKSRGWLDAEIFAGKNYPNARTLCRWATQDCMTLDGIPYVGRYSKMTPNLYVATGFNKWGMTSAMAAALLLTDLIQGKKNAYERLFSPSRSMLRPQLAVNAVESFVHFIKPVSPRCPHMGCALKYNVHEHSWDCPCHGSRFDEQGEPINGPAVRSIE